MRALDWIVAHGPGQAGAVEVSATPSVFGKSGPASYPGVRDLVVGPGMGIAEQEVSACPDGETRPLYIVDASYRDSHKAPASDPCKELWLFRECPGYDEVASFASSPYETDLDAYPTWPGRVTAIVLRRR